MKGSNLQPISLMGQDQGISKPTYENIEYYRMLEPEEN
jgi:hypothetical protein